MGQARRARWRPPSRLAASSESRARLSGGGNPARLPSQARTKTCRTPSAVSYGGHVLAAEELQHLYGELEASQIFAMEEARGRFLPDSLVGTITIAVAGNETTFYYLADQEERRDQAAPMHPEVASVRAALDRIAGRARRRNEAIQERLAEKLESDRGDRKTRPTPPPDALASLSDLHDEGVLSDEEFEAVRRRLLSGEEDDEGG